MENVKISNMIIQQLTGYVNCLTDGCYKPTQKMFKNVLLGMITSKQVMVSEIVRPLWNNTIKFRAIHKRITRGIRNNRWSEKVVHKNYLQQISASIKKNTLIAVDIGDITKTRAKKMPKMATVRDGSTGQLKSGWWLLEVEAINKFNKHIPLWLELFSVSQKKFKSFRYVTEKAISHLATLLGNKGIWLFDRGFDNWEFFEFLHNLKINFIIRINSNRVVRRTSDTKSYLLTSIIKNIKFTEKMLFSHKRKPYLIYCGCCEIVIRQSNQKLILIAAKGFGRHPLLLLTNMVVNLKTFPLTSFVRHYLKRWGVEESGRLIKQAFHLENIRLLSFCGLAKLVWLTLWCFGFFCWLRISAKKIFYNLSSCFPSFTPLPRFLYYRFANAVSLLFISSQLNKFYLYDRSLNFG